MICTNCQNKCSEYFSNSISDKANWEWARKMDKCEQDDEFHARANRLAEPVYIKGIDY